ncbi:hypothetical protein [Rhizocola hellebori]|uniref:hypothetical protein n=1 Tax=Rhizocola hellebori TaxID=1392758 RepID=UPI001941BAAA|nr:hypothetical protein [Rhizocola hellebori]
MTERIWRLSIAAILAVFSSLVLATPAMADPVDTEIWLLGNRSARSGVYRVFLPATYFSAGLNFSAPVAVPVVIKVDISKLQSDRVAAEFPGCQLEGQIATCAVQVNTPGQTNQFIYQLKPVGSPSPGPAGSFTATIASENEDPVPGNNTLRVDVDLNTSVAAHYTVGVDDVSGAVGDTVAVPVRFSNKGPNTLFDVVISRPDGGGGKDFVGGDGCVMSPIPQCKVPQVAPGATVVVNVKFRIRRCFQPVASDPDYPASVDGNMPVYGSTQGHATPVLDQPSDTRFKITVAGCRQSEPRAPVVAQPGATPAAAPTESASPQPSSSSTPSPSPSPSESSAASPEEGGEWVWRTGVVAVGTGSLALLLWRRARSWPR